MARCSYCNSQILFGGVTDGEFRFCNATCHQKGFLLRAGSRIPEGVVAEHTRAVHDGQCPRCQGPGPVDVHTSYSVWSALVMTSWRNTPQVCCQGCGNKSRLAGLAKSLALGWWGFPWGVIMTPVQVARNAAGLVSPPDPLTPSKQLESMVRIHLAAQSVAGTPHGGGAS